MSTAVIFKSKYGATCQYAEWLSESLNATLIDIKTISVHDLSSFSNLIFCSPVYFGKVLVAKFLKKNWNMMQDKKKVLLTIGSVEESRTEEIRTMVNANFGEDIQSQMKIFYVGGRMVIEKLGFFEKFITKNLNKVVEDEKEREKLKNGFDMVNRDKLNPIIEYSRNSFRE